MNEQRQTATGPSPENWHSVRAEIANQHTRAVLLINGASAVTLLAFLQAVWHTDPRLARLVLVLLMILCIGIAAGLSNWLRYETSLRYQAGAESRHRWSRVSNIVQLLPLLCFVGAVLNFCLGAWVLL